MIKILTKKMFPQALLLLLTACQSPLSEGKLDDLSVIDARIEISQDLTNKNKNEVTVLLYDVDGKPIRNKDIRLKVNSTDMEYTERQELYYTKTSKYSASDISIEREYTFQITLSSGRSYFLGSIRPLAENRKNDIRCDEEGDFNKDLVISWKNLEDVNELTVSKSVLLDSSTKTNSYYDYEPAIIKKIGGRGEYVIPKSGYVNARSIISSVEFKFNALKFGTMNPQLLKGSEIWIFGHIDKIVDFDEQRRK